MAQYSGSKKRRTTGTRWGVGKVKSKALWTGKEIKEQLSGSKVKVGYGLPEEGLAELAAEQRNLSMRQAVIEEHMNSMRELAAEFQNRQALMRDALRARVERLEEQAKGRAKPAVGRSMKKEARVVVGPGEAVLAAGVVGREAAVSALMNVTGMSLAKLKRTEIAISSAMDPRLQVACARQRMGLPSRSLASATAEEVAVVARVDDVKKWEGLSEVRVGSTIGAASDGTMLVTARIPVKRIEAVRTQPFVKSLKSSQPLRRALAATTVEMGTRRQDYPAQTAPGGGAGVVVGIVDYGCDFAHKNFRKADGSTRLLGIWDQYAGTNTNGPFGYGRLYTPAEINAALKKADPYAALGYGPSKEETSGTHGTHVMDIAAGNGRGSGVAGNAPEADLIFVEISTSDIERTVEEVTKQNFGDSVQMLEAVKFIFDQAGDRPCVVNVSLGTNGGPHDGSTLVEQGLDTLVKARPNRMVVIAASNSFADGIHAAGTVPANGVLDLPWATATGRMPRELELWLPGTTRVAVELLAPDGASLGIAEPGTNLPLADGNQLAVFVSNRLGEPNNGDNTISIFVAGGVEGGRWVVRLHNRAAAPAAFHAWVEREDREQSHFTGDLDNSHTIGSISCGHEVLAVGSFDAHKADRPISWFSSAGPTRDGRQKPEISAPGHDVVAARSRSRTGTTSKSGTSMATPAVTGLVALVLAEARRRNVQLTAKQLRDVLIQSARLDPPAQAKGAWDAQYGFGRAHIGALTLLGGQPPPIAAAGGKKPGKKPAKKAAKKAGKKG